MSGVEPEATEIALPHLEAVMIQDHRCWQSAAVPRDGIRSAWVVGVTEVIIHLLGIHHLTAVSADAPICVGEVTAACTRGRDAFRHLLHE